MSLCRGFGLCTRGYLLGGARALGLQAERGGGRKPLRELRESEAVWLLERQVCVDRRVWLEFEPPQLCYFCAVCIKRG